MRRRRVPSYHSAQEMTFNTIRRCLLEISRGADTRPDFVDEFGRQVEPDRLHHFAQEPE